MAFSLTDAAHRHPQFTHPPTRPERTMMPACPNRISSFACHILQLPHTLFFSLPYMQNLCCTPVLSSKTAKGGKCIEESCVYYIITAFGPSDAWPGVCVCVFELQAQLKSSAHCIVFMHNIFKHIHTQTNSHLPLGTHQR